MKSSQRRTYNKTFFLIKKKVSFIAIIDNCRCAPKPSYLPWQKECLSAGYYTTQESSVCTINV